MLDYSVDTVEITSEGIARLMSAAGEFCLGDVQSPMHLQSYKSELEQLCERLHSSHYKVMQGLCDILFEGIDSIIDESRPVTDKEIQFLQRIPEILQEYIDIPRSHIPDAHLLNHFRNPEWARPVSEDEEEKFIHQLLEQDEEVVSDPEDDNSNQQLSIPLSDIVTDAELDDEIDLDQLLSANESIVTDDEFEETDTDNVEIDADVNHDEFSENVIDLSDFIEEVSDEEPLEIEAEDYSRCSGSLQSESCQPASAGGGSDFEVPAERKELIQLVISELDDICDEYASPEFSSTGAATHDIHAFYIELAEQAETIANAVELIDLQGLAIAIRKVSEFLHVIALDTSRHSNELLNIIQQWPVQIHNYLNNIADTVTSKSIIDFLRQSAFSGVIDSEEFDTIESLLLKPEFSEDQHVERQVKASEDDISLQLPDNVNQELLDGLLHDLPEQAEEFSSSIQGLNEHHQIEYLEVAQRIAHTLKGAGNVVGVRGIASLTHHLEDILEIQYKAGKVPCTELINVLMDAADVLEAMSEHLMGLDEPPDNALEILQQILDWANRIDREGATEYDPNDVLPVSGSNSETTQINADDKHQVKQSKQVSMENMLRIPVRLADELLRIAGENLISTSQIQEYISTIHTRYRNLKSHNQALQQLSFELEHLVDVRGVSSHRLATSDVAGEFDSLEMDQYHELHSMSRRLVEIAADSIELGQVLDKDLAQLKNLVITQDQLQKENEELVLRTRMVSAKTIVSRLKRGIKQACRLTAKQVRFEVNDNDTHMDSDVLGAMIEPIMHILRNSVDHGIEASDIREKSGKPAHGMIKVTFQRRGESIAIDIEDDGCGLDIDKIRDKAVSAGLVSSASEVTEDNLVSYILRAGFTTRKEVSQVSGRGIGLDVVNSKIRELKGSLDIKSDSGVGCVFSITLPVSSFSTHSLLIRVRNNVYAISNRGVEEILYPGLGELLTVGKETYFKVEDDMYKAQMIESLLNISEDRRDGMRENRPVILIRDETGSRSAVLVQDVIDSRDVVVKSMGPYIPRLPGIIGATVLGDGSISPVVDLPELVHIAGSSITPVIERDALIDQHESTLPYVLVVDDSLSARKSLAQFVEDLGLDVRTARDGMEAVSLIEARRPDLILVDMEMPRMNGLELTSHIRADNHTHDLPVIMITSRSTDKHRNTALEKGVDHYMVKPFAEDELAAHINDALKIA